jgi:hypothetical protein
MIANEVDKNFQSPEKNKRHIPLLYNKRSQPLQKKYFLNQTFF